MIVFWAAFLAGQVICLIFDFFRSIRRISKPGRMSVAIQDVIFCTIGFRLFFDILYLTDNGAIRWYSLAAALLSSVLYFCTESHFIIKLQLAILRIISKIISPIICLLNSLKTQIRKFLHAVGERISTKLGLIRQFLTKKAPKPHEKSDVI